MKYIFLLLAILTSTPLFTLASDYSVTPLLIEHKIEPRDIFEESIKITNPTDRILRIFPTVNEITLGDEGEIKTFVPASMSDNRTSITSWIAIKRGRIEIAPGETIKIPVSISVNPNAEPGDYYAFVGLADASKRDTAEALVQKGVAPGTIIRLTLIDKKNEYLRLNRFFINRYIFSLENTNLTYDLENTGDVEIIPGGEVIFSNIKGEELVAQNLNTENIIIKPGEKHSFNVVLPDVIGHLGKYKAYLNIKYGKNQKVNLNDTVYFSVLPWYLILIIFAVVVLISIILVLYYHRRNDNFISDENGDDVPVFIRTVSNSSEMEHDINLKK